MYGGVTGGGGAYTGLTSVHTTVNISCKRIHNQSP